MTSNLLKVLGLSAALSFSGLVKGQDTINKSDYIQKVSANVLSTPDVSRFRALIETKDFTIKGFEKTTADTTIYGGHVKLNIPKTTASLWYRHDEGLNVATASVVVKDQFVFPFYLQFDDKTNEYLGNLFLAMGKVNITQKNKLDYGVCYVMPKHGNKSLAAYSLIEKNNHSTGLMKEYGPTYHLMHGFDNTNIGALFDGKINSENGDWSAVALISQNPGPLPSRQGPHAFAVYYGLNYFEEHVPYLSATGAKSVHGASAKIIVGELSDKLMVNLEAGYNTGSVAISAGAHYKEGDAVSVKPFGAISYSGEKTFAELKFSKNNENKSNVSLYFAIDLK